MVVLFVPAQTCVEADCLFPKFDEICITPPYAVWNMQTRQGSQEYSIISINFLVRLR
jgi:hypothetical protein